MSDPQSQGSRDPLQLSGQTRDSARPGAPLKRSQTGGFNQPLYFPLIEAQVIRLVELAPGAPSDPVVIRLFITELEHHPEYEALSYVWGDPKSTVPILCNGRTFDITVNLNAAFVRVRHSDRPRILWADAVCINQTHKVERSHHVSFMGRIYQHARKVLVCLGQDLDGGAEAVAALVRENADLMSTYGSVAKMPVLAPDDPLLDDPRWMSLAKMMESVWFTRAWVLQEVGLAKDPSVLYGEVEFSHRDLMKLAQWVVRCAPNLESRASVSFFTIHMDWLDWSSEWQKTARYPNETFLELLNHARWLGCREHRDHIYAFLGHPLALLDDGRGTIVEPDYLKTEQDVFLELAVQLIRKHGVRALSPVEHDEQTLNDGFPSWVPFRWKMEFVSCTFGIYADFYYDASAGADKSPPIAIGRSHLEVRGIEVDVVSQVYQFSASDLEDPANLTSSDPATRQKGTLDQIWTDTQDAGLSCPYTPQERVTAFSLTLCAGLSTYTAAEEDLSQHRDNFAAYWRRRTQPSSTLSNPGIVPAAGGQEPTRQPNQGGDPEKFWLDMRLVCDGRCFLVTRNGYFGLGPWIARPGDLCCVLLGATVPFVLRSADDQGTRHKLVGEAYVHGLMRGEAVTQERAREDGKRLKQYVLC